jgi:hypothetical protein
VPRRGRKSLVGTCEDIERRERERSYGRLMMWLRLDWLVWGKSSHELEESPMVDD